MLFLGMTGIAVKSLMPKGGTARPTIPTDAMQFGVHSAFRAASQHKKQVSAVLHLKKESVGKRSNPTAYNTGGKAFTKRGGW